MDCTSWNSHPSQQVTAPCEKESETSARQPPRIQCEGGTLDPEKVNLITGDAATEMRKMPPKSVHTIVTSFPYWPARRTNDPDGRPVGIGSNPPGRSIGTIWCSISGAQWTTCCAMMVCCG